MKKLWIFGDSFSDISGLWEGQPYYTEYCKQNPEFKQGTVLKGWYDYLAKSLNCKLVKFSFPGGSNEVIMRSVLNNLQYISKDDIIIIGWTRPTRFSIPILSGYQQFTSIQNDGSSRLIDKEYNLNDSLNSYYKNIFVPNVDNYVNTWINNINEFSNYLNQNFNFKSWTWWDIPHESIIEHFNNVHDNHPSVNGHYQIFEAISNMKIGSMCDWDEYTSSNKNHWD